MTAPADLVRPSPLMIENTSLLALPKQILHALSLIVREQD